MATSSYTVPVSEFRIRARPNQELRRFNIIDADDPM